MAVEDAKVLMVAGLRRSCLADREPRLEVKLAHSVAVQLVEVFLAIFHTNWALGACTSKVKGVTTGHR